MLEGDFRVVTENKWWIGDCEWRIYFSIHNSQFTIHNSQ